MSDGRAEVVSQSARQRSRIHFGIFEGQKQHKRPVELTIDWGFGPRDSIALCYAQAASAGSRIQGLHNGILVLVISPMLMSVGNTVLAYRKRNQFSGADASPENRRGGEW
jgi:hypothetical protein